MCEQASITNDQIGELYAGIIAGRQEGIDWMTAKLQAFD